MRITEFIKYLEDFKSQFGNAEIYFTIEGEDLKFNEVHDAYLVESEGAICEIRLEEYE